MKKMKYGNDFNKRLADFARTQFGQECIEYLDETYFNQISHTRGDSHETAFREGSRDVIGDLKRRIENANNEGN